jgi:1-acyl-sn-glycerol-3-phosphate acyltransferase
MTAALVILVCAPFTTPARLFPVTQRLFRLMIRASGFRIRVTGLEHVRPGAGSIYMVNHQSVLDHFILAAWSPDFMVALEKDANFRVPVYGWVIRWWGSVPIVRDDRDKALAAIDLVRKKLESGTSIGIAPEGTRSKDGRLLPFKKGGFWVAKETGASIIPVAFLGMHERNPDRKFRLVAGPLEVRFHPPVKPEPGESVDALIARVRAVFEKTGIPLADAA